MYYRISKNEKNLFFGKKIAQVWAVTLSEKQRLKVSKGANNRNRYNQVPHLVQDTNGKVTNS